LKLFFIHKSIKFVSFNEKYQITYFVSGKDLVTCQFAQIVENEENNETNLLAGKKRVKGFKKL